MPITLGRLTLGLLTASPRQVGFEIGKGGLLLVLFPLCSFFPAFCGILCCILWCLLCSLLGFPLYREDMKMSLGEKEK